MTRPSLIRAALTVTAACLALTACTSTGADVETKTEADAKAAVQQYADQLAGAIGGGLLNVGVNASPCTGKFGETDSDVYTVSGVYQVPLPAERHHDTMDKLKNLWTANGWKITDDRRFEGTDGVIAAKTSDGYALNVESTTSGQNVAVMVSSPCFKSPTPR
ncbi:hypothetical protein AB0J80_28685 [Actinoplanes sp. NPDC049548]|uniref:hypothetical protein n=1 Tax=Actinoplanes sp. NPDC049548 TaxID=3155152 RepID=UPI0034323881